MTRITTRMLLLGALIISALGVSALGAQAKSPAKPAITVTGGTVTVQPTHKTLTDLVADKIAPKAVKPATITKTAAIQAPVSGGQFDAKANGTLVLKGKLQLIKGKTTVTLSHFIAKVTKGKSAVLSVVVKGKTIKIATISKLTIVLAKNGKSATASGEAAITKAFAALINKLAGNKAAKGGDDLGLVSANLKLA